MRRLSKVISCLMLSCASAVSLLAQASTDIESPKHKAWDMLLMAAFSKITIERTNGIRALGLLRDNPRARELAENALKDPKPEVRTAAATALGQMHAMESIPKLEKALSDTKVPVVMAAAQALRQLQDEGSAYAVYYELLTGGRKSNDGLIAQQMETLKNPRELAKIGFSEGIGYIPFAGIGWDAYRTIHKKDPNPVRAVAATLLAHDPDPSTAKALVNATRDKNWIVRAAAVEAIAQRGDPSLLPKVQLRFADRNPKVRYSSAAAVIRLSGVERIKTARR
ncbi:MAG TPA: HEAT repeat domain-containing protein [Candidatus Sulfotelmatobacter sp.]|jgi:HEAT repeat protein|nr:HEAT repeat domain-containing protein [Candidatus Sulfotelmatobacter sp.]